jgi:hypothetical protein
MTGPSDPVGDAQGSAPGPPTRSGDGVGAAADVPGRHPAGEPSAAAGAAADPPGRDQTGESSAASGAAGTADAGPDPVAGEVPAAEGARLARVERAVHGTLSAALILEAVTVLFVPRAIAPLSDEGLTGRRLAFLLGLAGALVVASGLQRRKIGRVLGTVLQVPVVATGFLVGVMFVLGLLFAAVWIYLLRMRRELLGTARSSGGP